MTRKLLCTIGARGGSKGVKNKNVRIMHGRPLIAWTIGQAKESGLFDHIVISSDSEEILSVAAQFGAEVIFKRPAELATDTAPKIPVIRHALLQSEAHYGQQFDVVIDMDATSPLRVPRDLNDAYDQFCRDNNEILITAMPARRSPYFNLVERQPDGAIRLSKKLDKPIARRQDSPQCFDMNASFYIWSRDYLLGNDSLFAGNTGLYVMPEERSIDIDCELDWKVVEMILAERMDGSRQ